jgi:tetratricopeptide (TPR) repeat protein
MTEGVRRLDDVLERSPDMISPGRSLALRAGAGLAWSRGDLDRAVVVATEAVAVSRAVGSLFDEGAAHTILGVVANNRGDFETAIRHHQRSIELGEELGVEPFVEKMNLGVVMLDSGDHAAATPVFEELLERHRRHGVTQGVGFASLNLGLCAHYLGDPDGAQKRFAEARAAFEQVGFRAHVAHAVQGLAAAAAGIGRHEEAARLLGEAQDELDEIGWSTDDFDAELAPSVEWTARAALGDEAFDAAYAHGRATVSA